MNKDIIYNMKRNRFIKKITGNLGKVIEEKDKLICYVDNNKIKDDHISLSIACFGISDCERKEAELYGLNKKIYYVVDGLNTYKHELYVFGYDDCEVILRNCNFKFDAIINVSGKCVLENTSIKFFSTSSIYANKLVLKNIDCKQIDSFRSGANIMFCGRESIKVKDSFLDNQKIKFSFLGAKKLSFCHSRVIGKKVICSADTIIADDSSLLGASEEVNLTTKDFSPVRIVSPKVILNDSEVLHNDKLFVLKKLSEQLEIRRITLLGILNQISMQCQENNSKKILEYQQELNNVSVDKTLKRVK